MIKYGVSNLKMKRGSKKKHRKRFFDAEKIQKNENEETEMY